MLGLGLGISKNKGQSVVYDADAQEYFNNITTQPSAAMKGYYNTLILALKASGDWDKIDRLFIWAAEYEDNALTSIKFPASTKAEKIGTAVNFVQFRHYVSGNATSYLNLHYNPNRDNIHFSQDSGSLAVYCRSTGTNTGSDIGCFAGSNTTYISARSSGLIQSSINAPEGATFTIASGTQMTSSERYFDGSDMGAIKLYKNGVLQAEEQWNSVAIPDYDMFALGNNYSGVLGDRSTRQQAMCMIGGNTIDWTSFNSAILAFLTSVGANV